MADKHADQEQCVKQMQSNLDATPVVAQQLARGGELLDTACLRRWLRADSYSVLKAEARLRAHAEWRASYIPRGRIDESEIAGELAQKKAFLQSGYDKAGRPTLVIIGRNHAASQRDVEEGKRSVCYCLDRVAEQANSPLNPCGQICVICDLRGISVKNLDRLMITKVFDMLKNHYAEILGALWLFDAPSMFMALWKVVSPFMDPATAAKVKFVTAKAPGELLAQFDTKDLAKQFGGTADLVPIQDAALAFLRRQRKPLPPEAKAATMTNDNE